MVPEAAKLFQNISCDFKRLKKRAKRQSKVPDFHPRVLSSKPVEKVIALSSSRNLVKSPRSPPRYLQLELPETVSDDDAEVTDKFFKGSATRTPNLNVKMKELGRVVS
jgi:hypothetical protein